MLYLTTGSNGAGKTLFTLSDVRALQLEGSRPVFYNGRFALKPAIESQFGWQKFDFPTWQDCPDGSIFIVDECHNDLPLRAPSSAPPAHIAALAEHRRRGFDFFLITQHPSNIDAFVRRLIGSPGWHRHLKRVGGTKTVSQLEWPSVNVECEKAGASASSERSVRRYPSEVFAWYDSAVINTAKRKLPRAVYVFVAAILCSLCLMYYSFFSFSEKASPHSADSPPAAVIPPDTSPSSKPSPVSYARSRREYLESRTPYVPALPHTAPVYSRITEPTRAPVPAACIASADKCSCYSQQATRLDVPESLCRSIVEKGYFVEFDPDGQRGGAGPDVRSAGTPASRSPTGVLGASEPLAGGHPQDAGGLGLVRHVGAGARAQ